MSEERSVFGDRYELVRHIARGGMARVYLARDLLLDRPVALKVLFPELSVDESFVQRFRREARAAANLSHPNIVSIYDWGQGERTYYIVMEYVDGETLSARIRRGALSPDQAAIVGIATSAALAFAHRRQVIHRDVKPGNVLIDRSGQVKVADFGIARAVGVAEDLTQAGAVMGTATYFSPEQAQGQAVDARGDVYSLGVVLYEMVVGSPPFQGDTPVAIAYKHVREAPEPPRARNPAVPAALEAIILKALAKDPADRYQSAEELRADLERFRAGTPVAAAGGALAATTVVASTPRPNPGYRAGGTTTLSPAVTTTGVLPTAVPSEDPEGERSHTGRYVALGAVLLVALLAVVFALGSSGILGGGRTLTVPSLRGESVGQARAELRKEGFAAGSISERRQANSAEAAGLVVTTQPGPGTRLTPSSSIVLVVSSGPPGIAVPNVSNDTVDNAEQVLHADGFQAATTTEHSSTVPAGVVITTRPAPGTREPKGHTVTLVVSSGLADVTVPSVTGLSPAAAGDKLGSAGLSVGSTLDQASASIPAGEVIGTSPAAGTPVAPSTAVTMYVSSGPKTVTVPDILGDPRSVARSTLEAYGLKASFTTVPVTSQSQAGLVQSTNPSPGTTVDVGRSIVVALGSYTPPSTTTTTTTTTTTSSSTTSTTPSTTTSTTGNGGGLGLQASPPVSAEGRAG